MRWWWVVVVSGGCTISLGGLGSEEGGGGGGQQELDGAPGSCELGVAAFCHCADEYDVPCEPGDEADFTDLCEQGYYTSEFRCFADEVSRDAIDCDQAVDTCLPDTTGSDDGYGTGP